ncbi:MAG: ABC transporter permease [Sneathiella sp.]|jgi:ribose transport system permease protein|uniref:ABC transporter permease n=1 Tax=Sneathiella sp. TaxID=1964365 RepID=UPI000C50FE4A|nr:SMP-30/gluconolactonase/LRE family protein [Sneathiella sp.]MAL77769.1 ABC transporter permease [Sneathiella sp.]
MSSGEDSKFLSSLHKVPKQRSVFSYRRITSDLLNRNWIEGAIPFITFFLLTTVILMTTDGYFAPSNLTTLAQYSSDAAIVTIAMLLVVAIGGIDLSVGSSFALSAFVALYLFHIAGLPVYLVFPLTLACGALVGLVNGFLTGVLGCGALLATLGTMITVRGIFVIASQEYLVEISSSARFDETWEYIGYESFMGVPVSFLVLAVVAVAIFLMFKYTRFGWHILAVGGNRKAARHAGIPLKRVILLSYVLGGTLVGLAAFLFAARQNSAGSDTGVGLEFFVLTGLILGLGGFTPGRGSVFSTLLGFATIFILGNVLINAGFRGDFINGVMGLILITVLAIDMKYRKERHRILARAYLDPKPMKMDPVLEMGKMAPEFGSAKLGGATLLGVGEVDGPEDVILDRAGNLYCGTRDGRIMKLFAPDHTRVETYVKTGGRPLGLAFDAEERLVVCVAGMGLYRIAGPGQIERLTSQTKRSWTSIEDDRQIRMADDLDIAPDGRIYFTDATKRYEMETWGLDLLEGRGNGRLLCYNPADGTTKTICDNMVFPNGVCVTHDGKHLLVASTWTCAILIFDLARMQDGPRYFLRGLPGYPDNINRASDGGYWIALAGMRSPVIDLAMEDPGFRMRMAKRVPPTNWLFGNLNIGGVLKSDRNGTIVDAYWDKPDGPLYMITSMREHHGSLFLGGVTNNKIGRIDLDEADKSWNGPDSYWPRET